MAALRLCNLSIHLGSTGEGLLYLPLLPTNVSLDCLNFKVVVKWKLLVGVVFTALVKWKLLVGVIFAVLVSRFHMTQTTEVNRI